MSIRVGLVSAAHVHAPSFASCLKSNPLAHFIGVTDDNAERGRAFAHQFDVPFIESFDALADQTDALIVASENIKHHDNIISSINAGKHVLCEKPIAPNREHADSLQTIAEQTRLVVATAFPCPFSPNFQQAAARIKNNDFGVALAATCTNQGRCPFGWFTDPAQSGGGAMIDHVVHVADLLRRIFGPDVSSVSAQIGNNHYQGEFDDTAMVTIGFTSGVFATIDSSWSKPTNYHTWGNVKLNIIAEKGVFELDLFSQGAALTSKDGYTSVGSGSNLDALMVDDFLRAIQTGSQPMSTLADGLWASRIAIAAYESVAQANQPVAVR